VPTWDLTDPSKSDSLLKFGYDSKVDPTLDAQSRQVTRDFLRNFLDDMRVPGASGTNFTGAVPKNLNFNVPVDVKGQKYQVSYSGGDSLTATPANGGRAITLNMGQKKIEAMYLDNQAFGDLKNQLAYALADPRSVKPSWLPF
jgi:NTE family protein